MKVIDFKKSMLEESIKQTELKGYITSTKYYEALAKQERNNITELTRERSRLYSELSNAMASGTIDKGSEAWYEMCNQIDDVTLAIEEANTALIEYSNSIRDIEWEVFDLTQTLISDITNESDFLIDLMSNKKLYDDKGRFTDQGLATAGLHGQNYNVYMAQADEYEKEMLEVSKALAKDPYNQDLVDRRRELLELQQKMILAAEDEKDAIRDMVKEGIEAELNALQELINSYKDALDNAKDLYDYQKKISDITSEISSLTKQKEAYQGDDSEESQAKIQKINESLKEAQDNLEEAQYDRYISDQKKLLDDLYDEYERILNERLDNLDALIEEMIAIINENASEINDTLIRESENVGYNISNEMKGIWGDSEKNICNVLTMYGSNFLDSFTTVNATLNSIRNYISSMMSYLDSKATAKASSIESSSATTSTAANTTVKKTTTTPQATTTTKQAKTLTEKYGVALAIINGNYGWGNGETRKKNLEAKGFDYNEIQNLVNQLWAEGYIASAAWIGRYQGITDLSPYHINKFAKGARKVKKDQIGIMDEEGTEIVMRDGTVLIPSEGRFSSLQKGDTIFNAEASRNLWDIANDPYDFINDNIKSGIPNILNAANQQGNYTQNLDKVVFNFPNVKSYDEMLSTMQHDKNFERLIEAMTINRIAGKSSLAKLKAIH